MNGLSLTAGAAVVGALATSTWQDARSAVNRLLQAAAATSDPESWDDLTVQTRKSVASARQTGDQAAERRLAETWARRLQGVLFMEPDLDTDMRQVVYGVLLPMLPPQEQASAIRLESTAPRDQVISYKFVRSKDQVVRLPATALRRSPPWAAAGPRPFQHP